MTKPSHGFTLVELVIIITVLGILITVGIMGSGSATTWSQNKARAQELAQWKSTFELYKSRFAMYPEPSTLGSYCIGNDFPSDKCGNSVLFNYTESTELNTQLTRVTKLPTNAHPYVNRDYLGPYVTYSVTNITLNGIFAGNGSGTCPKDTTFDTQLASGVVRCKITLTR